MKASRIPSFLCIFLLLIGLSSAPEELCAQTFTGPEFLCRPTDTSVTVHVVLDAAREIYFQYGTSPGVYTDETVVNTTTANEPIKVIIDDLLPGTKYYYRMGYRAVGGTTWTYRTEHSFYTQRSPGSTFAFTITSDSHVNIMLGQAATWQQTLSNIANDHPDFHIDLGDTFNLDSITTAQGARDGYFFQRSSTYFGSISHSAPIFLAIGNHEQEEGWHISDSAGPVAVWCTNARKRYFPNPIPDGFYSGNADTYAALDGDQLHEDYYAWTWGNALFIVLDPFWYTTTKPFTGTTGGGESSDTGSGDRWDWTLGLTQYNWLRQTLANSNATYKFIFMHHMTGGTDDYIRDGAYAAPYCEWGGLNENGSAGTPPAFTTRRSGWYAPIHQVLVENGVSAVFHGHDHQYAHEMLDGIVYQSLPAAGFSGNGFGIYNESDEYTIRVLPSPGHLRVTVSPAQATVDYVATSGGATNYSYSIAGGVPVTTYDLTMAADPAGSGSTNPAAGVHSYAEGATVNITATPASGYLFHHWSGACSGSGVCQVTMDADKSVTAHFTELVAANITYMGDIAKAWIKDPGPPIPAAFVLTTDAAAAAGDAVIVTYAGDPNENLAVQVTDSAGNNYVEAARTRNYGNGRTYIFAAYNIKALPVGSTITITSSDSAGGDLPIAKAAVVSVFRGLAAENALDQTAENPLYSSTTATDPSSTPSVGPTATTTQADELLIAAIGTNGPQEDAPGSWQNEFIAGDRIGTTGGDDPESNWTISMGYRIVSATGQYTAGKSNITSRRWASVIATFKAGPAGSSLDGDIDPGSGDCDVDGSDLATWIAAGAPAGVDLTAFAQNFGKNACP